MQVEIVVHNPRNQVSGIGRFTRELFFHLSKHIDVTLVESLDPPFSKQFSMLHHFPIGLRGHSNGNIVHFTQIMGCAQMVWNPKRPAVATVHDLGVLVCDEDRPLFSQIDRRVLDLQMVGLRKMDGYAVNSEKTRDGLIKLLGIEPDRIHFVQLGVDSEYFCPIPAARKILQEKYAIDMSGDTFDLLNVGSELPRKNIKLILEALAVLKAGGYKVRFIKVGGPGGAQWRMETLRQIEYFGLEDNVLLTDVVPHEDLPVFYSAVDLCVTSTLLEGGFAWLAMEALACGKPVVASTGALIPKEAGEVVLVVPDYDAVAFASAIESLINSEDIRRKMGEHGRTLMKEYSWSNTAESMIQVYQSVME